MDGIARAGMVELKAQMRPGGQASTSSSQGDPSGGECTEVGPGIGCCECGLRIPWNRHPAPMRERGRQRC